MSDLIDRQDAIDAVENKMDSQILYLPIEFEEILRELPSAQPEIKPIEYRDCANAMLRMWMDNVVTDGEYKRIMDKLNAHWEMENE